MTSIPVYSKEEILTILRNAKRRKRDWEAKAQVELTMLQKEMEVAKATHKFD